MVPVDNQTFEKFKQLCVAYERKQGAQFRVMVENEWQIVRLAVLYQC